MSNLASSKRIDKLPKSTPYLEPRHSFILTSAMRFSAALYALLALPLRSWGFRNVTYNSNDTALVYTPSAWRDWPPNGCLSWPIGQWSTVPGTITLNFQGVAVYAYGLFDDSVNPIYTVSVDGDIGARLGETSRPAAERCEPLYSKTDLAMGNHTIVFTLTDERPNDVKDLSFQGFIVTVPEWGDNVTTTDNNNNNSTNTNNQNSPPKKKNHTAAIAGAVAGVAILAIVVVGIIFFMRRRKPKQPTPPGPTFANNAPIMPGYNPNPNGAGVPDPSVPPPVPFMVQHSQNNMPYHPPAGPSPWAATPDQSHLYPSPVATPFTNASTPPPAANNGGYINYYTRPSASPSTSPPPGWNQSQYAASSPSTYGMATSTYGGSSQYTGGTSDIRASYMSSTTQPSSVMPLMTKAEPSNAHVNVAIGLRPPKGVVDPNASGVERQGESSQGVAPPPQYMP
ncbi:hypothetical protein CPB86DRAFT_153165 [Serendipita vermifera]|nr:hypothetical protein CPB86DRAFT_153165 [Serendipita vermifera]